MKLRRYQTEAVDAALASLSAGRNPVLQLATGTGKSAIIAAICEHYRAAGRQAWMLTHVQQLVSQNAKAYERYAGVTPAIVCAGLQRKETHGGTTYGTIQSVTGLLHKLEKPDLIVIDEAHRVPHNEGEPGLYDHILRRYPDARRVAMTATPWRMDNGIIYGEGEEFWFDHLAYNYTVPRAVEDGWLCPLVGVETEVQLDVRDVSVSGDFVQADVERAQTEEWLRAVARSLPVLAGKRKFIAAYCPTVKAAQMTAEIINVETGWRSQVLHAGLKQDERESVLNSFYYEDTRVLCSVDMITTGFDFPALDCIACLRPTLSSSLWVQIQGRGTRLHPSKTNCLVLDYAGNLIRLGGVDMYDTYYRQVGMEKVEAKPREPHVKKPRQIYPGSRSLLPIDPMTGKEAKEAAELYVDVHNVTFAAITPRGKDKPVILAKYVCTTPEGARIDASQFLDTEKPNKITVKLLSYREIAVNLPTQAKSVTWQLRNARKPKGATVRKRGRYWNVIEEVWE